MDYATLERVPGSYVTDDLRDRADNIVWRVQVDGEWVYLYILIEFQSTVDAWVAARIMTYVGLLYQDPTLVRLCQNHLLSAAWHLSLSQFQLWILKSHLQILRYI